MVARRSRPVSENDLSMPTITPLRVALDATPLLGQRTGIGQYVGELLPALCRREELHLSAYAMTWRGRGQLRRVVVHGVDTHERPMPARPMREVWRRADMPPVEWWVGGQDVVHGTNFVVPPARRAAEVVTVHDLTSIRFPDMCTPDVLQYPEMVRRAVARGAWVHTPSRFVAEEVVEHFDVPPDRVVPVAHGIPAESAVPSPVPLVSPPYVLAIATIEPRKDLPSLVVAFDRLARDHADLRLVVAGPDGWGTEAYEAAVASAAHRDRIVRLGYVDNSQKATLLAHALMFAFPSVYEGFGLPPVEAMRLGVPVVATGGGSLPEILGDAASLVPVGDVDGLATAIERVIEDVAFRAELTRRGRERASLYTWDACALAMSDLYRLAHEAAAS